ncbi:uncharacterized protein DMENIID0001_139190 [Sergentomyia squamirostris]
MDLNKIGIIFLTLLSHFLVISSAPACRIYITVTPLAWNPEGRFLEVNWGGGCQEKMWIGVFKKDPSLNSEQPIYYLETHDRTSGYEMTGIPLGQLDLPGNWHDPMKDKNNFQTQCLPYFVAGYIGNDLVTLDCLKIQPQWQTQMRDHIGNISLKNLFIPGTHCSACYVNETKSMTQLLRRFVFTQDFDVWTQLVFGVRYLDVSIGYHSSKVLEQKFWIVADNIMVSPLHKLLQDVRHFVQITKEVVILDFGDFPLGFSRHTERHDELRSYLERELGDIAFPRQNDSKESFEFTLSEIQSTERTLLVTYGNPECAKSSNILWTSWEKHTSAQLPEYDVYDYFRRLFTSKSGSDLAGWVFYGVMSIEGTVGGSQKVLSSRERAASINRNLTTWFNSWASFRANAVAIDFIISSNLIDIALVANRHKAHEQSRFINMDYYIYDDKQ